MDLRTVLAAVLGVGLGLLLVVAPRTVLTVHTAGRLPQGRGGEYGADSEGSPRLVRLIQLIGVAVVLGGLSFGWQVLAV